MMVISVLDSWQYKYVVDTGIYSNYMHYLNTTYSHSHKTELIYQLAFRLFYKQGYVHCIRPCKYSLVKTYNIRSQVYKTFCPLCPAFLYVVFLSNVVPYFTQIKVFHSSALIIVLHVIASCSNKIDGELYS